jgi:hypoxanthine-DNA glycosylase
MQKPAKREGIVRVHTEHPFPPVINADSRVLILGTMPSPASLRAGFYYAHPQNRFWRVMGCLLDRDIPQTAEGRLTFCQENRIALWDVLHSCAIVGADDASIREPVAQPVETLLSMAKIRAIFTTGTKAQTLYRRHVQSKTGMDAIALPSTSAANCRYYTFDALLAAYRAILPFLLD